MINSDLEQTLVSTLPDDLIFDNILPRLPVKTLLRFRTVCKLWLSIISSSRFAKSHLKVSSLSPQFVVLFKDPYPSNYSTYPVKFLLIHYDENYNVTDSKLYRDPDWMYLSIRFMASCNGLLCLYYGDPVDYFVVWNPATEQSRIMMIPCPEYCDLNAFGFSYASSIDDYKIIAENKWGIFCFSLRSGQWKTIHIDGKIHQSRNNSRFYARKELRDWKEDKCIVGFDLVDEKLKEIPYMNWLNQYNSARFIAIKENVSLYCHGDYGEDVWVLKQFGDWSSWEKEFSRKKEYYEFETHEWSITETGKTLLQNWPDEKVIHLPYEGAVSRFVAEVRVIDLREGALSRVVVDLDGDDVCHRVSAVYVESMISPFVFPSLER